jgi:hypothetical protein
MRWLGRKNARFWKVMGCPTMRICVLRYAPSILLPR